MTINIVEQGHEILTFIDANIILRNIERAGRTCYKSEEDITPDSAIRFCQALVKRGHESVIEHESFSVRFITDRGVTHEMVRHRLASISQESTRYVNYDNKGMTFVKPVWYPEDMIGSHENVDSLCPAWRPCNEVIYLNQLFSAQKAYNDLIEYGERPEQARSVLPNSTKAEITLTANVREWRHILKLRCGKAAHPQIRELMRPLLKEVQRKIPVLFDDITY